MMSMDIGLTKQLMLTQWKASGSKQVDHLMHSMELASKRLHLIGFAVELCTFLTHSKNDIAYVFGMEIVYLGGTSGEAHQKFLITVVFTLNSGLRKIPLLGQSGNVSRRSIHGVHRQSRGVPLIKAQTLQSLLS